MHRFYSVYSLHIQALLLILNQNSKKHIIYKYSILTTPKINACICCLKLLDFWKFLKIS